MRASFWSVLVAGLWVCSASAEVYRWVDDNGELQFGDQPPAETTVERLELKTDPGPGAQVAGDDGSESGQDSDASRCDAAVTTLMDDIQWYKGWVLEGEGISNVPPRQVDELVNRYRRYESLGGNKLQQMCWRYWEQAGEAFCSCSEGAPNHSQRLECATRLDPVLTERYLTAP